MWKSAKTGGLQKSMEEAKAYERLNQVFNLTQDEIAKKVSKKCSLIYQEATRAKVFLRVFFF